MIDIRLDSEALTSASEGFSVGCKKKQREAVHEFGHILGLDDDEYLVGIKYEKVYDSIMNRGESVLYRHTYLYMEWLEKVLTQKGIK